MLKAYPWLDQSQSIGSSVVDSGWKQLIERLLEDIDAVLANTHAVLIVLQVKEKLGTLRFYRRFLGASDLQMTRVADLIDNATAESARTCIACGAPGVMRRGGGWIACLCDAHAEIEPL